MRTRNKLFMVLSLVATAVLMAAPAFATDPVADVGVTGAFTTLQAAVAVTLVAVAGIAILLFAVPYAWRYAKGLFKTVSKG